MIGFVRVVTMFDSVRTVGPALFLLLSLAVAPLGSRAQTAPASSAFTSGLDELFGAAHAEGRFSGVVLVAIEDTALYHAAFGMASYDEAIPNARNTRFRIASVTKSFTAFLLLRLVEENLVDLETPLSTYLPQFPEGERITIHQLLTNTGGIAHYEGLASVDLDVERFRPMEIDPAEYAELIGRMPLAAEPGSRFHYSSFGYDLLGLVIERTSGMSYAAALHHYVTAPLGMEDTGYAVDTTPVNLARGHEPAPADSAIEFTAPPFRHISNAFAAGGLYSTSGDLHTWSRALHDERILAPRLKQLMRTNHLQQIESEVSYGYGLAVHHGDGRYQFGEIGLARPYVIHGGSFDGYRSLFVSIDGGAATVVILSNVGRATDELALGRASARLLEAYLDLR